LLWVISSDTNPGAPELTTLRLRRFERLLSLAMLQDF
jgi:hypothetical protein